MIGDGTLRSLAESAQQPLQFLNSLGKKPECLFNRFWSRHINARVQQGWDWELRPATAKKTEVAFDIAGLQHVLRKSHGSAETGGVLVYIKGAVEMRNTQAFKLEFVVNCEVSAEIDIEQSLDRPCAMCPT